MDRGSYISASGGIAQFARMELVNNNLANVNTPGFKGQFVVTEPRDFADTLANQVIPNDPYAEGDHEQTPDTEMIGAFTDFSQGPIKETGNLLDVALRNPNEFFVIETQDGLQYTRAGNFTINTEGNLVTQDGQTVQGDGGAITTTPGKIEIVSSGAVLADGLQAGRLQVVTFNDTSNLERVGANRFALKSGTAGPEQIQNVQVVPQALEMSNVSMISSMLQLITANRGFEMYAKTARTIDEMNQSAITQLGRPR